jgi:hypothetical protein
LRFYSNSNFGRDDDDDDGDGDGDGDGSLGDRHSPNQRSIDRSLDGC